MAVMYNIVFIIVRAVFWELQEKNTVLWCVFDYMCDALYIVDMVIGTRTGMWSGYLCDTLYISRTCMVRVHVYIVDMVIGTRTGYMCDTLYIVDIVIYRNQDRYGCDIKFIRRPVLCIYWTDTMISVMKSL
jgi:hypothetical protein